MLTHSNSFGYLDGVSQPAVLGIDERPFRGQEIVRQGIILLGREGDTVQRPIWALDGSFLAFRYLSQLVPEFQSFVDQNNPSGAPEDFLGSRLFGRWKSGLLATCCGSKWNKNANWILVYRSTYRYHSIERRPKTWCG